MTRNHGTIGASHQRAEDARLLTGRGRFVGDVKLPRMLTAAFVRSTNAYARLHAIDVGRARRAPGVHAVFTAADLPAACLSSTRHPELAVTPQPVLAVDRVRFVGEPVAIVVADDGYLAEDAADLVDVEYDQLDREREPLFEHLPDNVVFRDEQRYGDIDEAFAAAAAVVGSSLRFPRQVACPLEARGCVADYDPASRALTIWSSTQAPHRLRRDVAKAIDFSENRIRVIMHDIGGGFGQKIPTHVEDVAVVLAAIATGRPIKWVEDRRENLVAAPHSRDQEISLELALDDDLRFTGLRAEIRSDAGAYSFNSASCLTEGYQAARSLPGVYRLDNYAYRLVTSLTTKSPVAPYRGVGMVAAHCARELLIDKAARELAVDRYELRERNMIRKSDLPYTTATGWVLEDVSLVESLQAARIRWEQAGEPEEPRGRLLRGVGISPYVEPSGTGSEGGRQVHGFASPSHDCARAVMDSSGKATIAVGTPSLGQGLETTMAQVAADELGIPLDEVTVVWGDTSHVPLSLTGSRASRAAVVSGGAVGQAARMVRSQILGVAGQILEASPDDLEIRDGQVWVVGDPKPRLSVAEVASAGHFREDLRTPSVPRTFEATSLYDPPATYSNACVIAAVDVDPATGAVRVQRIVAVEDCGTMINPMIVEGQFVGAVAQAIGSALLERFAYSDDGQPLTATLMDYLQPTASDTVRVELSHVTTPSSKTWRGMKGVGESGVIGTVAAIATAVADAIAPRGATVDQLPMLPGTVWGLLRDADNAGKQ